MSQNKTIEKCTFCTKTVKLMNFECLEAGDHIKFGHGQFSLNVFQRNVIIFAHHAIVTQIDVLRPFTANVALVSFKASPSSGDIEVKETMVHMNLTCDNVFIIKYCLETCKMSERIQRARRLLHSGERYNMLWNNCEHLAHYCCTGIKRSNQVYNIVFQLKEMAKSTIQHLLEFVLKLSNISLDDVADNAFTRNLIGQGEVVSVYTIVYLLYCVYQHLELYKDLKNTKICNKCFKDKLNYMWMKFLIYCSTMTDSAFIISLVISSGVCGTALIGVKVVLFLASAAILWIFPSLRARLSSPFQGRTLSITALFSIRRGDVVSYKKFGVYHHGVVVETCNETKRGKIGIVHYSSTKLFGKRTIVHEYIEIDLDKDVIRLHDYSGIVTHACDKVVERAMKRVGETKYGFLSNRSCNFCHWAKVDTTCQVTKEPVTAEVLVCERSLGIDESISPFTHLTVDHKLNKQKAPSGLSKTWARIREDVQAGQIVRLKVNGANHYGITTSVSYSHDSPSVLSVQVVYRGNNNLCTEDTVLVDLNKEDIWLYKYHPVYQFKQEEIVQRAKMKVENRKLRAFEKSFRVPEEVVHKQRDVRLTTFRELIPGDVVLFYYWSLKHPGVVTDVLPTESQTSGYLSVIHYTSDSLLSTSVVRENCMFIDLNKDDIFRKSFEGYVTYSNKETVNRARSILGEKKYSMLGNTSWELVHWAKVVQNPFIVTRLSAWQDTESDRSNIKEFDPENKPEKYLLLPELGDRYGDFQRHIVHNWKELKPGTIVEIKPFLVYHQGILVDVCEETRTITLIYYKPYAYLPMEIITKEKVEINLQTDDLYMYRCDPLKANKASRVISKAMKALEDPVSRMRRGSWSFCVDCVVKHD